MDDDDDDDDGIIQYYKQFETARTAVFWDMQDCGIPDGLNALEVSQNIRLALKEMNYSGPASIYAYCETEQIWDNNLESTAMVKNHKPEDEEGTLGRLIMERRRTVSVYADESIKSPAIVINHTDSKADRIGLIIADMLFWAMKNPTPKKLMLIVGDISKHREFVLTFHHLLSASYNLLFAQPSNASAPPALPVDTKLVWESLSAGEI